MADMPQDMRELVDEILGTDSKVGLVEEPGNDLPDEMFNLATMVRDFFRHEEPEQSPALPRFGAEFTRVLWLAEHLFAMVPQQVWRDSGGDDQQGHYEGDFRAEQTLAELTGFRDMVGAHDPLADEETPRWYCELLTRNSRMKWDVRGYDVIENQRLPEDAAVEFVLHSLRHHDLDNDRMRVRVSRLIEVTVPLIERSIDVRVVH